MEVSKLSVYHFKILNYNSQLVSLHKNLGFFISFFFFKIFFQKWYAIRLYNVVTEFQDSIVVIEFKDLAFLSFTTNRDGHILFIIVVVYSNVLVTVVVLVIHLQPR